jgi:hypothetical protein
MKRRRATIAVRRRIFLGCEGESEQGYGALLARLAEDCGLHLAFQPMLLRPGGGDPLDLVSLAAELSHRAEIKRGPFAVKAVLLDRDKLGLSPARDQQLYPIAAANQLHLIWQDPSHEAFLLRHLAGCGTLRPQTTALALTELRRRWDDYRKPMPAVRLAARLGLAELVSVCVVEESLRDFLEACGFTTGPEQH